MPVSLLRRRLITALPLAPCAVRATSLSEEPELRSFRLTTSDGVRLNVLEAAPAAVDPALPVIVLVPGWCMPATIWRAQLQALGQRFRTLAVDPRGQGDSEIPAAGYDAERRADDLRDQHSDNGNRIRNGGDEAGGNQPQTHQ